MLTQRFSYYEGMFLFPQTMATRLQEAIDHINTILGRAGAEVVAMQKWGERALAYPINKSRRGIYILIYFKCDRSKLAGLERDCNLSEVLLRMLVTRADHLTLEEMQAFDQAQDMMVEAKVRADESNEASTEADAPQNDDESSAPAEESSEESSEAAEMSNADG